MIPDRQTDAREAGAARVVQVVAMALAGSALEEEEASQGTVIVVGARVCSSALSRQV